MFFSIVVPVYNVETYLKQCVDSILVQTFTDFEVILVDDGSKDESPRICDEYAEEDGRVQVIHKPNGGLSDARNVGTARANGKYIVYIDSDDYYSEPTFLEKLYDRAIKTEADVICYKFQKYYEKNKEFSKCPFSCPEIENYKTLAERVNYMVKRDAFYCSAWSKCFKREIVENNNINFEKGLLGEDQEWYYHILCYIKSIEFIDEVFVVYRQRDNSITSSWRIQNLRDCVYIVEKWSKKIPEINIDSEYKRALLNSIAKLYCNLLIAYSRFDNLEKKQYFSKIKDLSYLLKYHVNPRVNVFYKFYRILGFTILMKTLKAISKLR